MDRGYGDHSRWDEDRDRRRSGGREDRDIRRSPPHRVDRDREAYRNGGMKRDRDDHYHDDRRGGRDDSPPRKRTKTEENSHDDRRQSSRGSPERGPPHLSRRFLSQNFFGVKDFCRELNIDPKWPDLQTIYDEYKRAYDSDRAREMHILWRGETWYKDLYMPENVDKQFKNRISRAKLQAQQFFEQLRSGQMNINLNADKNIELLPSDLRHLYEQSQKPATPSTTTETKTDDAAEQTAPETVVESSDQLDSEQPVPEEAEVPAAPMEVDTKPTQESAEREAARQAARESSTTLFIKAIPKWMSREQVEAAASAVAPLKRLIMSNANPGREFIRMAWAEYDSNEQAKNALLNLSGQKFTNPSNGVDIEFHVSIHISRGNDDVYGRTEVIPALFSDPDRMLIDLAQARRLMDTLDKEKEIENNPLNDTEQNGASTAELLQQTLDKIVVYLRRVHLFDYYRGHEYLTEDSMILHSGSNVLRGVPGLAPARAANNMASICDERVNKRIETPVTLASFAPASQIERVVNEKHSQHCTVLEPEKVRCDKCQKLFKGVEFVKKHLINRHADVFMALAEEEQFFQNYLADPNKLTASTLSLARFDREGGKGKRGKDFGPKQHGGGKSFPGRGRGDRFNGPATSHPTPAQAASLSPPPGRASISYSDLDAAPTQKVGLVYRRRQPVAPTDAAAQ